MQPDARLWITSSPGCQVSFLPPCQQFDLTKVQYCRYAPCHSCTKSIFVIFSWQGLWKMPALGSHCCLSVTQFVLPVKTLDETSHSNPMIYGATTQNPGKLALILFCFNSVSILTECVTWFDWPDHFDIWYDISEVVTASWSVPLLCD